MNHEITQNLKKLIATSRLKPPDNRCKMSISHRLEQNRNTEMQSLIKHRKRITISQRVPNNKATIILILTSSILTSSADQLVAGSRSSQNGFHLYSPSELATPTITSLDPQPMNSSGSPTMPTPIATSTTTPSSIMTTMLASGSPMSSATATTSNAHNSNDHNNNNNFSTAALSNGSWTRSPNHHHQQQQQVQSTTPVILSTSQTMPPSSSSSSSTQDPSNRQHLQSAHKLGCPNGSLLTFELATGFIYKPSSSETLSMVPSTLQLTDCLDACRQNGSCLAINFEMGLCVLLSSSADQNPSNLYTSQFPVFTIYAEKKCLLAGNQQAARQVARRCQRAWTFERVAGFEMRTKPRRKVRLANRELCMEACLLERDFECRSANWLRDTLECQLSDQDRHSVSQSEAGDQNLVAPRPGQMQLYGPANWTGFGVAQTGSQPLVGGLYQNYYYHGRMGGTEESDNSIGELLAKSRAGAKLLATGSGSARHLVTRHPLEPAQSSGFNAFGGSNYYLLAAASAAGSGSPIGGAGEHPLPVGGPPSLQAPVDYLENNCVYEPNKLCEFRKIQNRILKTVDSIYQEVGSLEECKQRCLNAPYRCYSFDYGDTSDRVCRTSHLDQASLSSVKEPYLEVVGAITYELAACFNVTLQCRAREMLVQVSSSKLFKGRMYAKSRPNRCLADVGSSLRFELALAYNDDRCDVQGHSSQREGVFSQDLIIQHHDRIVTTQDVGLSVFCHYDLTNKSVSNSVDLSVDKFPSSGSATSGDLEQDGESGERRGGASDPLFSKLSIGMSSPSGQQLEQNNQQQQQGVVQSAPPQLAVTRLATTVVRSPNVTMRITNMNGHPVNSATVGDRLALLFEIKEKTSPFGILIREIVATDGRQIIGSLPTTGSGSNLTTDPNEATAASVQLLDSLGCPTNANIMGPLIKLDQTGQRLLAPFDAFKFPNSEMVFFRAVVSSCIFDCRPSVCGPSDTMAIDSASGPSAYLSPELLLPSTTIGASNSAGSTTTTTSSTTTTTTTTSSTTRRPPNKITPSRSTASASGSGDSLTTVAGFPMAEETELVAPLPETNQIAGSGVVNPSTLSPSLPPLISPNQLVSSTDTNQAAAAATSNPLDSLSVGQMRQLIKLVEARLRGQLGAGSEAALTNFTKLVSNQKVPNQKENNLLDSILLANPTGSSDTTTKPVANKPKRKDLASLQALANEYLGALQPPVIRHRRWVNDKSINQIPMKMINMSIGEGKTVMFHIATPKNTVASRRRRDLTGNADPADELVVQAIKILDRPPRDRQPSLTPEIGRLANVNTNSNGNRWPSNRNNHEPDSIIRRRQSRTRTGPKMPESGPSSLEQTEFEPDMPAGGGRWTTLGLLFLGLGLVSAQLAMLLVFILNHTRKKDAKQVQKVITPMSQSWASSLSIGSLSTPSVSNIGSPLSPSLSQANSPSPSSSSTPVLKSTSVFGRISTPLCYSPYQTNLFGSLWNNNLVSDSNLSWIPIVGRQPLSGSGISEFKWPLSKPTIPVKGRRDSNLPNRHIVR